MKSLNEINILRKNELEGIISGSKELSELVGELNFVFGYGPENADTVLIGEAPGKDEVRLKRPFVGKAGAILSEILQATGIKRESLYITNTVKYRLARPGARPGSLANRPASAAEIRMGLAWLEDEISIIKPKLILTLGTVPLKALCFITNCGIVDIGACHGKASDVNIGDIHAVHVPLYHPASQIYNRSLKDIFDADFKAVRALAEGL